MIIAIAHESGRTLRFLDIFSLMSQLDFSLLPGRREWKAMHLIPSFEICWVAIQVLVGCIEPGFLGIFATFTHKSKCCT